MDPEIQTEYGSAGRLPVRVFETGATRDVEEGKIDPEGFLSPLVIERYSVYMHHHRLQKDGTVRDSDNWQKGIPLDAYMKSGWRHFLIWWKYHRGFGRFAYETLEDALCGLLFNVSGYLHELIKRRENGESPFEAGGEEGNLGQA